MNDVNKISCAKTVFDFKMLNFGHNLPIPDRKGVASAHRTNHLLSAYGFHSETRVQQMCSTLSRRTSGSNLFLFRSIALHGLCPTDVSREPPRYRNLFTDDAIQTLSCRDSGQRVSKHLGRRQREKRLAYLCRFRSRADSHGQKAVCQGRLRFGTRTNDLCSRFYDNRSLSFSLSLGTLPQTQRSHQVAHPDGFARQYSLLYLHFRRQNPRRYDPRPIGFRTCRFLHYGPGLHRFWPPLWTHPKHGFLCARAKKNLDYSRRSYRPINPSTGLRSDQTILLKGVKTSQLYPDPLRRISYFDAETNRRFVFLTNNFVLPALTIVLLFKYRWRIELFSKWIKQHLRIKAFYGTSQNAVKTQTWIAISIYVLVAIVKKKLKIDRSLNEILQILSIALFENSPLLQVLTDLQLQNGEEQVSNQLNLFNF